MGFTALQWTLIPVNYRRNINANTIICDTKLLLFSVRATFTTTLTHAAHLRSSLRRNNLFYDNFTCIFTSLASLLFRRQVKNDVVKSATFSNADNGACI